MSTQKAKSKIIPWTPLIINNIRPAQRGAVGAKNGKAKLSDEQIREMRQMHETSDMSLQQIADLAGCGKTTAYDIVKYNTRTDVV